MKDAVLAVITTLKADTAVSAVVGTRIYKADDIPATPQKPFIAVGWVTRVPEPPTSSSTYAVGRIQCVSFETSGTRAATLSDLIGDALAPDRILNTLVSGVVIVDIDDMGSIPYSSDGKTTGTFRDNHDFMITYRLR